MFPGAPSSFMFLVAMPGAPSSFLVTTSKALVTRSDALVPSSFLLLVVSYSQDVENAFPSHIGATSLVHYIKHQDVTTRYYITNHSGIIQRNEPCRALHRRRQLISMEP